MADPIYSVKLLFESKRVIHEAGITGNVLIIHSGGGLSLAGFQSMLSGSVP